ncbi:MAG: hypothetical protein AAGF95_07075 [Chloroflexota bacterium]
MRFKYDRWLTWSLYASTLYNALGAIGLALPEVFYPIVGVPTPTHPLYQAVTIMTVVLFGIGYFWLAYTGHRDRTFLAIAALGKASFFGIFVVCWLGGYVPWMAPLGASGDLVFAVLFGLWLWENRNTA